MKEATEDKLSVQTEAISNILESFKDIDPLRQISKELLQEQYVMLVLWATSYFDVVGVDSMDLWAILSKVMLEEEREIWELIELFLCCTYGNSVCESFISYLRVVKTD